MQKRTIAVVATAVLSAGCGDLASVGPDAEQPPETSAVIFPDDPAPSESCALGVPLSCGTTTWTIEYTSDFMTRARRQSVIARSNTASISGGSSGGTHMLCTATSDFVAARVHAGGVLVDADGYRERADKKGVDFIPRITSHDTIPPLPGARRNLCTLWCSPDGPVGGCNLSDREVWKAQVTGPGVSRTATLSGVVEDLDYNDEVGVLHVYCRLTLPKSQLVTSRRRPNDVISTSGSRFVRGYELTGTPLRSACNALAQKTCVPPDPRNPGDIVGLCINPRTESCISDFRDNPDPCRPACQQTCTSTAQCGSHAICSGGCCRANPH